MARIPPDTSILCMFQVPNPLRVEELTSPDALAFHVQKSHGHTCSDITSDVTAAISNITLHLKR